MPEDLSINEIESISELLVESVFGFTDAFAEQDEADDDAVSTFDFYNVYFTNQPIYGNQSARFRTRMKYFIADTDDFSLLAREISSPPPRS